MNYQLNTIIHTASDGAFYPLPIDITNYIGIAKQAMEMSELDQVNLRMKIEVWRRISPNSSHYFRPYIKKEEHTAHVHNLLDSTEAQKYSCDV